MNRIFLLLGSNMGNAEAHLNAARLSIQSKVGAIIKSSSVYSTKAWGKTDQPDFLNQVIEVFEEHSPEKLLKLVLEIEIALGRTRIEKWGPRVIDIDILFFNSEIIREENLTIPHSEIANRRFTLIPLQEIAPAFIHPVFQKTMTELLIECKDTLEVTNLN